MAALVSFLLLQNESEILQNARIFTVIDLQRSGDIVSCAEVSWSENDLSCVKKCSRTTFSIKEFCLSCEVFKLVRFIVKTLMILSSWVPMIVEHVKMFEVITPSHMFQVHKISFQDWKVQGQMSHYLDMNINYLTLSAAS